MGLPVPFIKTEKRGSQHPPKLSRSDSLAPIADAERLFLASVEHGADDHETRGNRAFAHAQDKTNSEEAAEALASGMRAKSYSPSEDIDTAFCVSACGNINIKTNSHLIHFPTGNFWRARF